MNNILPLVSVILPCYNCEHTIKEAMDSIISQSYENWNIIVCDDCSTDRSYEILKEYKVQLGDKMILLKNEKNSKIATTLNHCLKYATGKYVARMDGDDRCKSDRFEKQVAFLESHPKYDCIGGGIEVFDETGIRGIRLTKEYPQKNEIFKSVPFAHPTVMMKRSVYDALGGYRVADETLRAEDVDLWFRFWQNDFKGYNLQEVLLEYRENPEDFKKRTLKAAIGTTKVLLKYWKEHEYGIRFLPLCYKPIMVTLLPRRFLYKYHQIRDRKNHTHLQGGFK